jgi:hypothetical protein
MFRIGLTELCVTLGYVHQEKQMDKTTLTATRVECMIPAFCILQSSTYGKMLRTAEDDANYDDTGMCQWRADPLNGTTL